ncbi:MAG: hypothetical protein KJZ65_01020, partial [Phycisphaerales bacterium]|nr:hypothetical protein [Phycisphaerales bacterium]
MGAADDTEGAGGEKGGVGRGDGHQRAFPSAAGPASIDAARHAPAVPTGLEHADRTAAACTRTWAALEKMWAACDRVFPAFHTMFEAFERVFEAFERVFE